MVYTRNLCDDGNPLENETFSENHGKFMKNHEKLMVVKSTQGHSGDVSESPGMSLNVLRCSWVVLDGFQEKSRKYDSRYVPPGGECFAPLLLCKRSAPSHEKLMVLKSTQEHSGDV